MANNENVSQKDRKGKQAGNGFENESLDEVINDARENEAHNMENTEVMHYNRHLHKDNEIKAFEDTEE